MNLGLNIGSKVTGFVAPPDGGLRPFSHQGVSPTIPAVLSIGTSSNLYGTQSVNAWSRYPQTTYSTLKRVVGVNYHSTTLQPPISNLTPQQIEQDFIKDIRTIKENTILKENQPIFFQHPTYQQLFAPQDGPNKELELNAEISAESLLAMLLQTIHQSWATQNNSDDILPLTYRCNDTNVPTLQPISRITTTCPPWYSTSQRIGLLHAYQLAQLPLEDIVHDYFALLHTYTIQRTISQERYVIFYDLGHTQTTVSLAHIDPAQYIAEILDFEALPHLGVRDIVDVVLKKIKVSYDKWCVQQGYEQAKAVKSPGNPTGTKFELFNAANKKYLIQWTNIIHKNIEKLTTTPTINIELPNPLSPTDEEYIYKLSREEFEKDITDLILNKFFAPITRLLQRHEVLLIQNGSSGTGKLQFEFAGGGGRIPLVQKLFQNNYIYQCKQQQNNNNNNNNNENLNIPTDGKITGFKWFTTLNSDEAVARGAAFAALSMPSHQELLTNATKYKKTYQYSYSQPHLPSPWRFVDHTATINPRWAFPQLKVLYAKLQCSPQYHTKWYNDLQHFTLLLQRDNDLKAFLTQCNLLENLCYHYIDLLEKETNNNKSNEIKTVQMSIITECQEWLETHRTGDYREVDIMIGYLKRCLGNNNDNTNPVDMDIINEEKQKLITSLQSYQNFVQNEQVQKIEKYHNIAATQKMRFTTAQDLMKDVSQEMITQWIGSDFHTCYISYDYNTKITNTSTTPLTKPTIVSSSSQQGTPSSIKATSTPSSTSQQNTPANSSSRAVGALPSLPKPALTTPQPSTTAQPSTTTTAATTTQNSNTTTPTSLSLLSNPSSNTLTNTKSTTSNAAASPRYDEDDDLTFSQIFAEQHSLLNTSTLKKQQQTKMSTIPDDMDDYDYDDANYSLAHLTGLMSKTRTGDNNNNKAQQPQQQQQLSAKQIQQYNNLDDDDLLDEIIDENNNTEDSNKYLQGINSTAGFNTALEHRMSQLNAGPSIAVSPTTAAATAPTTTDGTLGEREQSANLLLPRDQSELLVDNHFAGDSFVEYKRQTMQNCTPTIITPSNNGGTVGNGLVTKRQIPRSHQITAPIIDPDDAKYNNQQENNGSKVSPPLTESKPEEPPGKDADIDARTLFGYKELLKIILEQCDLERTVLITLIKLTTTALSPANAAQYKPDFIKCHPTLESQLEVLDMRLSTLEQYIGVVKAERITLKKYDKGQFMNHYKTMLSFRIAQRTQELQQHQEHVADLQTQIDDVQELLQEYKL